MGKTNFGAASGDTRYWGEQGGSYSVDGRYRWSYEWRIGEGPTVCWIGACQAV